MELVDNIEIFIDSSYSFCLEGAWGLADNWEDLAQDGVTFVKAEVEETHSGENKVAESSIGNLCFENIFKS